IDRARKTEKGAKANLIFTIVVNLFILSFFKYYGFLIDTFNGIFGTDITYTKLALPIGISFYTFQALSYIIDVYRGEVDCQKNFLKFAVYISMFPQLIAGPIIKYRDISKQLGNRKVTREKFGQGIEYFIFGLSKKVLLANNLGLLYTQILALDDAKLSVMTAWIGIAAYTMQIYFDFSGYSDMAIGLGKMLGFDFPANFNYPYISKSITEFWRRWHISLSTWFREYLYIPLGGNRVVPWKHIRNILVVWLLTGLWHGASWNFVFWGLYYGLFLMFEKYVMNKVLDRLPGFVRTLYTLVIVAIGWVFFSQTDMGEAFAYIGNMFGAAGGGFANGTTLYFLKGNLILLIFGGLVCRPAPVEYFRKYAKKHPMISMAITAAMFILSIAFLVYDSYNPFLYFRF
ncbi:MAG: MBOAT family protein, partial [Firmicutes bacterium]|nr:MBOAT family protein [Bacillota bacterium]